MECGIPADIPNGRFIFVNGTRRFKSFVQYDCEPGYVAVGRTDLMCDVDERWNGPPPRCDPVYCEEPTPIRHGGFSLSTNSTVFGTVAAYYCTSPRHMLMGAPKLTCLADGSWDAPTPVCKPRDRKSPVPDKTPVTPLYDTEGRPVVSSGPGFSVVRDSPPKRRVPNFRRKPIPIQREPTGNKI